MGEYESGVGGFGYPWQSGHTILGNHSMHYPRYSNEDLVHVKGMRVRFMPFYQIQDRPPIILLLPGLHPLVWVQLQHLQSIVGAEDKVGDTDIVGL